MSKLNSYNLILNALGVGPKTANELKKITKRAGVLARIAEFNRYFGDIEIGKTNERPKRYYLTFPSEVKLNTKKLYPNAERGVYALRTKNAVNKVMEVSNEKNT